MDALPKSLVIVFSVDILASCSESALRDSLVETTLNLPILPIVYTCDSPVERVYISY